MKFTLTILLAIFATLTTAEQSESPLKLPISSLAYFQGAWSCSGHFFKVDRNIAADVTFRPDLNGSWLAVRHDDRPPNQFHAMELWGFDATAKHYVAVIADSGGGVRLFTSPGWTGDSFIWTGDGFPSRQNGAQRFTFEKKNPREFVMTYHVLQNEEWKPVDTLACDRR
jgi:Protein of unknown function (DUF1579)